MIFVFLIVTIVTANNVSGPITVDTIWTQSNGPYFVTNDIMVTEGIALTIQDGVTVEFINGTGMEVKGALIARGKESSYIIFTSNQTNPHEGDWRGIAFISSSGGATFDKNGALSGGSILEYCEVQFAGGSGSEGAITCSKSAPYLKNVTVNKSASNGIAIINSEIRIKGCNIQNNADNGILIDNVQDGGIVRVLDCSVVENRKAGIDASFTFGTGFGIFENNCIEKNRLPETSCG